MEKASARQIVNARISPAGVKKMDEVRGHWSRSEYVRRAVAKAIKDGLTGPQEVQL